MLFSSLLFLYLFLPLTLLGYYVLPNKFKNYWLLFTSLIFFAWGGVSLTGLLLLSIFLNYCFGIFIQKNIDTRAGYWWTFTGVSVNLLFLGIYKYTNFIIFNLNQLFETFSIPPISQTSIILPIGISFYTFHSLSYLIDIYRRKTTAQKNIFDLALYISMFSQLIAGPIIRYSDIWQQLTERKHTLQKFSSGVERFLIGLGKKVLLANAFAKVADFMFENDIQGVGALNAWLGICCYTLQIYCDFAGYSDMAIGLGRMFGFEFKENFNFPYLAKSVKEFWRRWHISLSTFFRDYVYFPLGGNRITKSRTYLNLLFVFFLTGFWHGASWSFVVWGLFHGFFMILERLGLEKLLEKSWKPFATLYTLLVVMFAWVLFRANTLSFAIDYWKELFNFSTSPEQISLFMKSFDRELMLAMIIALLGSVGFFKWIADMIQPVLSSAKKSAITFAYGYHIVSAAVYAGIIILCTLYLVAGTYNPFIYYRF
ncbi:MBOAT family O-acyltransferase [Aurantibacillus circumpalustris]|uniref:MBOAT family O-acyltransferase n=1 Tax=Aurantibacillus circumpalustris TaxID=3036359 RepID=UPI00295C31C7|nr:MBOAT family O-acyltransferase [Aurantibacillus circumpalustris]